eukprot:CAMPEP_0197324740 /NCGR_PEP_ID=MMETSP0891-20130614/71275_1 /TAXON_ID=44058 ORGANISM="Aureoumbra lagunensis, Strain CCMP1510" /NCGR_SAMPLE_ID=MMETSP0891 /ASSEMBLY_ACC=CAM_ASM_000534 /LENGTH=835 /DNA_ID=CAMNT_0042817593 /DNA_START=349 /DNA_END=2856 /DNA_ORIENTATION=-
MNLRGNKEDVSAIACELCDSFLSLLLKFDSVSPEDVSCHALCPGVMLNKDRCVAHCERIVSAISTSSHYPCMAAGLCQHEETGRVSILTLDCSYDEKARSCSPSSLCRMTKTHFFSLRWWKGVLALHAFRPRARTRCEPHPGLARWASYQSSVARHGRALASALVNQPLCGEPGAHPVFCVRDVSVNYFQDHQSGWHSYLAHFDLACDRLSVLLVVIFGLYRSIRAVETPGGADAKQHLTFWCIVTISYALERNLARILLSRLSFYYVAKLSVVIWLVLFEGSATCYHRLRALRFRIKHSTLWRKNIADAVQDTATAWDRVVTRRSSQEGKCCTLPEDDMNSSTGESAHSPRRARPPSLSAHERYRARKEKRVLQDLKLKARLAGLSQVLEVAEEKGITEAYRLALDRELGDIARSALFEYLQQQDLVFLYAHIDHAQILITTESDSEDEDILALPQEEDKKEDDENRSSVAIELFDTISSPTSNSKDKKKKMRRLSTIEEKQQHLSDTQQQYLVSNADLLAGACPSPRSALKHEGLKHEERNRRSSYPVNRSKQVNRADSAPSLMPPKLPRGKMYERGHSAEEHIEHHHRHSIAVDPDHEPVHFFDKKHSSEQSSVHAASSYYVVLHIVPSKRANDDLSRGDLAALVAKTHFRFLRKNSSVVDDVFSGLDESSLLSNLDDEANIAPILKTSRFRFLEWLMRQLRRGYACWRQTAIGETLLGFFESEALVSTRSKIVRSKIAFAPNWSEDLELFFAVGGSIDQNGVWHNPCCCYTSLLVQLWLAEPLRPDKNLGETILDLAPLLHGVPERIVDLPLSDGTNDTALLTFTLRFSSR